jgi:leucyl/phenylalanyl-tRNA--protein transferase
MFAKVSDASKVAFAVLVEHLREWGFEFIDCQVPTDHLKSLGAKEISRKSFLERLKLASTDNFGENEWRIGKI